MATTSASGLQHRASTRGGRAARWIALTGTTLLLLSAVVGASPASAAAANIFTVNQTGDQPDADTGDGICDHDLVTGGQQCTLRAAIQQAIVLGNDPSGPDEIRFDVPGAGPHTIAPASALPVLAGQSMVIDGSTDPDGAIRIDGSGAGNTAGLIVQAGGTTLRGLSVYGFAFQGIFVSSSGTTIEDSFIGTDEVSTPGIGNGDNGIQLSSNDNTVRNTVVSGNALDGILIGAGAGEPTGNVVEGNRIGTNGTGTQDLGNGLAGVRVAFGATGNTIGGSGADDGNVISGNDQQGVVIQGGLSSGPSTGNLVAGNRIGTTADGAGALGNASQGVAILGDSAENEVRDNVTSANAAGVFLQDSGVEAVGPTANVVAGNLIGTAADGITPLGNSVGVRISSAFGLPFDGNRVGGTVGLTPSGACTGDCNVIADSAGNGIEVQGDVDGTIVQGNHIGVDAPGTGTLSNVGSGVLLDDASNTLVGGSGAANVIAANNGDGITVIGANAAGNAFLSNSIHDNGGLGIDLADDGVTANDAGDGDAGANGLQNFPELLGVVAGGSTHVAGTLDSTDDATFRIEVFANGSADPSGNGEADTFLGARSVRTGSGGVSVFAVTVPGTAGPGEEIAATATVVDAQDEPGSTSELSTTVTEGCTITGTPGDDVLPGTGGDDVICGQGGDDLLGGAGGDDVLIGGAGSDTVDFSAAAGPIEVDLAAGIATGASTSFLFGIENVLGSPAADTLRGNPGPNLLDGGGGDDLLVGRAGGDRLLGGSGKDLLRGGSGGDILKAGGGRDVAKGGGGMDRVVGQSGRDLVAGQGGHDTLRGQGGNDRIKGGPGKDLLNGGPGTRDFCKGGGGADTLKACELP